MIVVADTTPFNYLVQLELVDLLQQLYGVVYVPRVVVAELLHPRTPAAVRAWASTLPSWVIERRASQDFREPLLDLDPGEREAISLALEIQADRILIDDQEGRLAAERMGLAVAGTLSVVKAAAEAEIAEFDEMVAALLRLGFRASREVIEKTRPQRP